MRFLLLEHKEEWRAVVEDPRYEVSSLGRVRSYARSAEPLILRPGLGSHGYPMVVLGRGNARTVHSLVAGAFLGPRPAGQEVRHKNGDRSDPRAENLEYGTRSENIRDAVAHGTWMSEKRSAGVRRSAPQRTSPEARRKAWATRRARYGSSGCRS